nr:hypothetical protein [Tanacetum cinerariifolium]
MILESVENGPLLWPSIEENRVTQPKKYSELSATEEIQADCDVKATNIILQGLPPEVYALVINQQPDFSQSDSGLIVLVFQKGDDPIDAINHMMLFLTVVVTSRYPLTIINCEIHQILDNKLPLIMEESQYNQLWGDTLLWLLVHQEHTHQEQVETISRSRGILSATSAKEKVTSQNSALNQRGKGMSRDDLILSVIEQLKTKVVTCTKINQDNKHVNDLLTAEFERYKSQERVLNELKNDEKASTSYEYSHEIESLKHTLSEYLKEKESLEQKITILKDDF